MHQGIMRSTESKSFFLKDEEAEGLWKPKSELLPNRNSDTEIGVSACGHMLPGPVMGRNSERRLPEATRSFVGQRSLPRDDALYYPQPQTVIQSIQKATRRPPTMEQLSVMPFSCVWLQQPNLAGHCRRARGLGGLGCLMC